jgi:hypothetical protein
VLHGEAKSGEKKKRWVSNERERERERKATNAYVLVK